MPIFSRRNEEPEIPPTQAVVEEPAPEDDTRSSRLSSFFGQRRSSSLNGSSVMSEPVGVRDGDSVAAPPRKHSLLHRSIAGNEANLDPSILRARERVVGAENAEREAERILQAARAAVHEAVQEVKHLELESQEQMRLAKIKEYHVRDLSKRNRGLGRFN